MKTEHFKMKKIIITAVIFIFAFLIILGSALLTKKSGKKEKNLEISEPKKAQTSTEVTAGENNKSDQTNRNQEVAQSKIANEINDKNQSKIDNSVKDSNNTKKTSMVLNVKLPVANPDAVALCKQAQTSSEKNIYLTFDDGPSPNVTPQILSILDEYNVPATFFVLGSRVELYPDLVRQEYEAGHYIANHGYTHTYSSIYSSVQSVLDEYNQTEKAVQDALGNSDYHTLLFRFPGGSSGGPYNDLKQEAKRTLENMGIPSTNWNCLNGDAEGGTKTKEQLLKRLYETANGWDSLVVLMHDANDKQTTADALPEIIEHYKVEGYTFKNYYEIFQ